jgi:hypothetical protein
MNKETIPSWCKAVKIAKIEFLFAVELHQTLIVVDLRNNVYACDGIDVF